MWVMLFGTIVLQITGYRPLSWHKSYLASRLQERSRGEGESEIDDYYMRFINVARLYSSSSSSSPSEILSRLRQARVVVIGLGGVGSWVVEALARSGIGHLILIDADDICVSNVNRQLPAASSTVGKLKGEVLKSRVLDINPTANVTFVQDFLRPSNLPSFFASCDSIHGSTPFKSSTSNKTRHNSISYVVDCADGVADKAAIVDYCVEHQIPIVVSGGAGGLTDPTLIRVSDMARSIGDTLVMRVRKKLRRDYGYPAGEQTNAAGRKIDKKWGVQVVHSLPMGGVRQVSSGKEERGALVGRKCDVMYGNACFSTGTVGFVLASVAVNAIASGSSVLPRTNLRGAKAGTRDEFLQKNAELGSDSIKSSAAGLDVSIDLENGDDHQVSCQ